MLEKDPDKRIGVEDIRVSCCLIMSNETLTVWQNHPWVTDNGKEPMISTEDNLYHVGKHVEEPTQEELRTAIGSFSSVL